jgi:hypothetical protein
VPWVEAACAHAPDQRFILSLSRRTPYKTPKISLIAAGSVIALAGIAAGTTAVWPSHPSAAPASFADAASFASGSRTSQAAPQDTVLSTSVHQLKTQEATARQAAIKQAIARQQAADQARRAAQARAAAAAATRAAAARAAAAAAASAAATQQAQAPAAAAPAAPAPAPPVSAQGAPQAIAQGLLGSYGWSSSQFSCLQPLWNAESGWNVSAANPTSGAFGIPQALPGSKMASAGPNWQTDAATQIRWGLGYIRSLYGSPCGAWSHEQSYGWY